MKVGDRLYCYKRFFSTGEEFIFGEFYEIVYMNTENIWLRNYLPIRSNELKKYFLTEKQLRKKKLERISEL